MKLISILTLWLVAASTVASAPTNSPKDKQSPGTIYSIGKCSFRINNLFGGAFSAHKEAGAYTGLRSQNNPVFPVYCKAGVTQDDIDEQLDAKQVSGQWIWIDGGEPFTPDQHFRVFKFTGRNWTGTGTTYDDITGDESHRVRHFQYCLIEDHGPQSLCGSYGVMSLNASKSSSTLPPILAVLKTIEFVDQPVPNVAGDH